MAEWAGVGIPADKVESIWGEVLPLVERVLATSPGEYDAGDILTSLLARDMQLWAACLDGRIKSVCVTQLVTYPKRNVCVVLLLSGNGMEQWLHYVEHIKTWARSNGAHEVRITGRRGWVRKLGWQEIGAVCREVL